MRLAIPRKSLLRLVDQYMVIVNVEQRADGRARFEARPVAVDESMDSAEQEYIPVLHGLAEGERVVSQGAILFSEALGK